MSAVLTAESELKRINGEMAQGIDPDPVEIHKLGIAIDEILGIVRNNSEQQRVLVTDMVQFKKEQEAFRKDMAMMRQTIHEMQEEIPKQIREQAQAKLGNAITSKAVDFRQYKGAKRDMVLRDLKQQAQVEVEWPYDPFPLSVHGIAFYVERGVKKYPKSIADTIKDIRRNKEMQEEYDKVLKEGKRRSGKRYSSMEELQEQFSAIGAKYRSKINNPDTVDGQTSLALQTIESRGT